METRTIALSGTVFNLISPPPAIPPKQADPQGLSQMHDNYF